MQLYGVADVEIVETAPHNYSHAVIGVKGEKIPMKKYLI